MPVSKNRRKKPKPSRPQRGHRERDPLEIPPVSAEELAPLLSHGLEVTAHIFSVEASVEPFSNAVMRLLQGRSIVDQTSLHMRALMGMYALTDHRALFLAEKLLQVAGPGQTAMHSDLLVGFAKAPLRIQMGSGQDQMTLDYRPEDIVRLGKAHGPQYRPNSVLRHPDPNLGDVYLGDAGPMVSDILSMASGPEQTLGGLLSAHYTGPLWKPDPKDFPELVDFERHREQLLNRLDPALRPLYESPRFPDTHDSIRLISSQVMPMPADLRETMIYAMGVGPWSFYPLLNEKADWNYAAFKTAALSSTLAASIPCRNGCLPAFYIAHQGSGEDFRKVLELFPPAASSQDLSKRPLLIDLAQLKNPTEKIATALQYGADPQACASSGVSAFTLCGQRRHYDAAVILLRSGYKPLADASMDQVLADQILAATGVPPALREAISAVRARLPKASIFNQMAGDLHSMTNELRAAGGFGASAGRRH